MYIDFKSCRNVKKANHINSHLHNNNKIIFIFFPHVMTTGYGSGMV